MSVPFVEVGVPLPTAKAGRPGLRRQATMVIGELARAEVGASVFVAAGTYAHEPEGLRVAAMRAGGIGWYAVREVEGGWRIWKMRPCGAISA